MGGINQQQYQQSQHQFYNPQQNIPIIAQPGVPQGQRHMNPGGAYNGQFCQQNNVISGQPCINTGIQGQQWMGQKTNGLIEMVQQIHQTNMDFLFMLSSIEKNVAKLVTIEQDISGCDMTFTILKKKIKMFRQK